MSSRKWQGQGLACLAILLFLGLAPLSAQTPSQFRQEFWAELPSMPQTLEGTPFEAARALLISDAAYVFAGEIWGFSFEWTPSDSARNIAESFSLEPTGAMEEGDPLLHPEALRQEGDRVLAYVSCSPGAAELSRVKSYSRSPWKGAQGRGRAIWNESFEGRKSAYADAAKNALRELLRGLEPNKPRRVKGKIVFASPPRVWIAEGLYQVEARFKVEVTELLSYEVY